MPKLTIDGVEIEVAAGTSVLEAAKQAGVEVPHYCYHPGLSIAGQCRLCMVDVDKVPRPQISCNMTVADGMVVHTKTERVVETRRSVMEFHLINHPLDCPVCDQAGECWLQIYYMRHGLYDPRMADEKVHKPKAMPLGPHVILDAERCILCSRCVRFCDEVTGTGELGIFHRGDHSEIGLFPGKTLENKYASNVIDICPVGALTDRDFRFQVRVWYLDSAKSVCNGCARGCNVEIHTSRRRPHHNQGKRVARIKPRENAQVNKWWICDAGRYGFDWIDDESRLTAPTAREAGRAVATTWDAALAALGAALRRYRPEEIGVLASPQMSNEDLFALKRLADQLHLANVDHRVPPAAPGDQDDFLIRADKNPNTRGAELIGLSPGAGGLDGAGMIAAAGAGRLKLLWIFHHDLSRSAWAPARSRRRSRRRRWSSFRAPMPIARARRRISCCRARPMSSAKAPSRISRVASSASGPRSMRSERRGRTGRSSRGSRVALGLPDPALTSSRADQVFQGLAGAVPAYAGMSYRALGDGGLVAGS